MRKKHLPVVNIVKSGYLYKDELTWTIYLALFLTEITAEIMLTNLISRHVNTYIARNAVVWIISSTRAVFNYTLHLWLKCERCSGYRWRGNKKAGMSNVFTTEIVPLHVGVWTQKYVVYQVSTWIDTRWLHHHFKIKFSQLTFQGLGYNSLG